MANDIMIRKASKDFVCSCCGHIIRKGDEYLDKCIFNVGKIVKHDRYHDKCPHDTVTNLFETIKDADYKLPFVDSDGNKWYAKGITQGMICATSWDDLETETVPIDRFLKECQWQLN